MCASPSPPSPRRARKRRPDAGAAAVEPAIVLPLLLALIPAMFVVVLGPGILSIMNRF